MQENEKKENNELTLLIGKNIATRRKKLGLSQKELAQKLDVTDNAIIRMEKGMIAPKMGRMQEIADTLECPVVSLFITHDSTASEYALYIADRIRRFPPQTQEYLLDLINSAIKFAEKTTKK